MNSTSMDTPLEINVKYSNNDGELLFDPTTYRQLIGSLIYLTITRPDISYVVNLMSQFMHQPHYLHPATVNRVIPYLLGTFDYEIFYKVGSHPTLRAYIDANWAVVLILDDPQQVGVCILVMLLFA